MIILLISPSCLLPAYFLSPQIANYVIPAEGEESPFKEIIFTDLQREDAAKLIETYNKVSFKNKGL